jgi:hypothetical protein
MPFPLPPLVAARKPRTTAKDWDEAKSWFGGRPQLGSQSWPRHPKSGEPLIFVAQIDLGDFSGHAPEFPAQGSLAFFLGPLGSCDGAVVYVQETSSKRPTDPPSDAHPVREIGSWPFAEDPGPGVESLFPRWPLQLKPIDVDVPGLDADDADLDAMTTAVAAAMDDAFPGRDGFLTSKQAVLQNGGTPLPHWWHSAGFLAACLQNALHSAPKTLAARAPWLEQARAEYAALSAQAKPKFRIFGQRAAPPSPELERAQLKLDRVETQHAAYHRDLPALKTFVSECVAFAAGHRPTDMMTDLEWTTLANLFQRARGEFKDFARYGVPFDLSEVETQSMIHMLTADETAYLTIPAPVRAYVNGHCLLPSSETWHQMFGRGVDIQGGAIENSIDHHMLLQLVYDNMMHWRFGDVGAYQFWIKPADVKARNWSAARLTFECH